MNLEKKDIIAVDFDGTLCENQFPEIGAPNTKLIKELIHRKENGDKLILWTNRVGDRLDEAVRWCQKQGLIFDAVNDNLPEIVEAFGSNSRKVFANIYIDDRAEARYNVPFVAERGGMLGWAEREVELACNRERGDSGSEEGMWDYGCSCYESALKAFASLCKDGHSGMSIGLTKQILVRLIEGKPLLPIEDTEDAWNKVSEDEEKYQCKRMSSLFKDVLEDGTVKYADVERYYCKDIHTDANYRFGLAHKLIDEMYPITMPYIPEDKPYVAYCEDFLFDQNRLGDFDTFGIIYLRDPKENDIVINKFYKETADGMVEISEEEYLERRKVIEEDNKA